MAAELTGRMQANKDHFESSLSAPAMFPQVSDRTRRFGVRFFFGAQILVAAVILLGTAPRLEGDMAVLVLLIALNIVAELMPISVYGTSYISIGFVMTMALIITFGAPGVIIAAPFEAIAGRFGDRRKFDYLAITNAARFVIVYWLTASVYAEIAPVGPTGFVVEMVPAVLAASAVCYGLSVLLHGISMALRNGTSLLSAWEKHRWLAPHYLALGAVGLALALADIALGVAGIIAFVTPAAMMRLVMKQYVDKTRENVVKLTEQNRQLQAANVQVRRVSEELRESYDGTLEALVSALDARDQETKGHSLRVSHYMMDLARELGIKEGTQHWTDMARGSLLHDVGKIGITDSILLKPDKLTEDEWKFMRQHPDIGYSMLKQVRFLQGAAEIVLAHHERWDGKGYPRGLRAEEIPLGARIFNIVDAFDAITSDRPYRKARTTLEALNEILKHSGEQFDPLVVEAFLDTYSKWEKELVELHGLDFKIAA